MMYYMKAFGFALLGSLLLFKQSYSQEVLAIMPYPSQISFNGEKYHIKKHTKISFAGNAEGTRVEYHLQEYLNFLDSATGLYILNHVTRTEENGNMSIVVQRKGELLPGESESYSLEVGIRGIIIEAETDLGVIHAFQTLRQLVDQDEKGYFIPYVQIRDQPRFPWRGLLIDVCRHFMPIDVLKRNIRAMNRVKLNVLHLHLTEDQGFRIESKTHPKLHKMGSEGKYFTQEEMKDLILFADTFGIRVVPEFDIPGHTTSWLVGYPELGSHPGPYKVGTTFGVQNAAMDPTNKDLYPFLDEFLGEMAVLFPDSYIHIGGDEVNEKVWEAQEHIRTYKEMNGFRSNEALQAYFNREILTILTKYGKKMIGWDEILQPELGNGHILIQSWRGRKAMYEAAEQGYKSILSNGYYIDLCQPSRYHYLNDPIPADSVVSSRVRSNILGGEATMWAELVDENTVDGRIWPRSAAIAERLWSPVQLRDVRDMYTRLGRVSARLKDMGLKHTSVQKELLKAMAGPNDPECLEFMVQFIQPIQGYSRHRSIPYTTSTPLNRIPDAAVPDPLMSRDFYYAVEDLTKQNNSENLDKVESTLVEIRRNFKMFKEFEDHGRSWKEEYLIFENLDEAAELGLLILKASQEQSNYSPEWKEEQLELLKVLNMPSSECELAIYDAIRLLIETMI